MIADNAAHSAHEASRLAGHQPLSHIVALRWQNPISVL